MNKRYYEHTLPIIRGSLSNTYYQEKNGKIIPYVPALKKVSKTKRNNSLKM